MCSTVQSNNDPYELCSEDSGLVLDNSVNIKRERNPSSHSLSPKDFQKELPDIQYNDFCRQMLQDLQDSSGNDTCNVTGSLPVIHPNGYHIVIQPQSASIECEESHQVTECDSHRPRVAMSSPVAFYTVTSSGTVCQKPVASSTSVNTEKHPATELPASVVQPNTRAIPSIGIPGLSADYFHKDGAAAAPFFRSRSYTAGDTTDLGLSGLSRSHKKDPCDLVGDLYSSNHLGGLRYCPSANFMAPLTSSTTSASDGCISFGQYLHDGPSDSSRGLLSGDSVIPARTASLSSTSTSTWNPHSALSNEVFLTGDNNSGISQSGTSNSSWSALANVVIPMPTRILPSPNGSMVPGRSTSQTKIPKVPRDKPEDVSPSSFLRPLGKPIICPRPEPKSSLTDAELVAVGIKRNCKSGKQKPSYLEMVASALLSSPEYCLPLCKIYDFLPANFPHISDLQTKSWRNSVRHSLSSQPCFVKAPGASRSHMWRIHEANVKDFKVGIFDSGIVKKRIKDYITSQPSSMTTAKQPSPRSRVPPKRTTSLPAMATVTSQRPEALHVFTSTNNGTAMGLSLPATSFVPVTNYNSAGLGYY